MQHTVIYLEINIGCFKHLFLTTMCHGVVIWYVALFDIDVRLENWTTQEWCITFSTYLFNKESLSGDVHAFCFILFLTVCVCVCVLCLHGHVFVICEKNLHNFHVLIGMFIHDVITIMSVTCNFNWNSGV
jgi:hypothetical protein